MSDYSEHVHADVGCLRPLSRLAYASLQSIHEHEFSIDDLLSLLRGEPTLTAELLDIVSREPYSVPGGSASLSHVVAYIGNSELVRLVAAACFGPYFADADAGYGLEEGETWRHSLACGIVAEFLAERTGTVHPAAAFTGGLLHNVGKTVVSRYLKAEAAHVGTAVGDQPADFIDIERSVLGTDHAAVGGILANRWLLPAELRRCIRNHHDPDRSFSGDALTPLIHVADAVCMQVGLGTGIDGLHYPLSNTCLERLGLCEATLDRARIELLDDLERAGPMLAMATRA